MKEIRRISNLIFCLFCFSCFVCCSDKNEAEDNGNPPPPQKIIVISDKLPIADPFILFHDDTYYAYGTTGDSGFDVYYTQDLKYWKKSAEKALKREDSYGDKWFWAPEVYYNKANKKFYLYYSAEEHICVAVSDSPLGPFTQNEKKAMRDEKSIDSSIFVDDDGTPYLYFVRFTNGNVIWCVELEKDLMTIKSGTLTKCIEVSQKWEESMDRVVEGPSIIKKGGVYYLIYSGNHYKSQDYGVGFATSSSPRGTWKKYDMNPIFQKPKMSLVGTGHGAPFLDKDGKYRYIFHAHASVSNINPRTSFITDLSISDNGIVSIGNSVIEPKVIK